MFVNCKSLLAQLELCQRCSKGKQTRFCLTSQHMDSPIFQTVLKTSRDVWNLEHPPRQKAFQTCVFFNSSSAKRKRERLTQATSKERKTQEATVSVATASSHRFMFVLFCPVQIFSPHKVENRKKEKEGFVSYMSARCHRYLIGISSPAFDSLSPLILYVLQSFFLLDFLR